MTTKNREIYEKTRNVKNNDKSKKYILKGEKNTRYYNKIISKSTEKLGIRK